MLQFKCTKDAGKLLLFPFFFSFFLFFLSFRLPFLRRCIVVVFYFRNDLMTFGSYSRAVGWTLMFMNVSQFTTTMYMWKIHYVLILYLTARNSFYISDGYGCKNDFPGLNCINLLSTTAERFTPPYITVLWSYIIIIMLSPLVMVFHFSVP